MVKRLFVEFKFNCNKAVEIKFNWINSDSLACEGVVYKEKIAKLTGEVATVDVANKQLLNYSVVKA